MTLSSAPLRRRVLVSAGDPSGDLILSQILRELKELYPKVEFEFTGLCGAKSQAEGVTPLVNTKDVAVVGIVEVLKNLKKIFGALGRLSQELKGSDSLLCVDFPDFNLRLATMAKKIGTPCDYIVAPQVWAWRHGRLPKIRELVRRLYPALGFEESLFREAQVDAKYMGHPLRDLLPPRRRRESREKLGYGSNDFVLAMLPGSRSGEIARHLPLLIEAWGRLMKQRGRLYPKHKNLRGLLVMAPSWTESSLLELLDLEAAHQLKQLLSQEDWKISSDSHEAMMGADFGWITSGTATLEAAYYQLPHILLYKLSSMSVFLLRSLSSYFSDPDSSAGLPNILLKKKVIPELLQGDLTAARLALDTTELLLDTPRLTEMGKSLRFIPKKMGEAGACRRIAADLGQLWGLNVGDGK